MPAHFPPEANSDVARHPLLFLALAMVLSWSPWAITLVSTDTEESSKGRNHHVRSWGPHALDDTSEVLSFTF